MLALKSFLASFLRGGREPRHLFLAVVLGFTAGSVCGWNLTFAALVCLAALLNCSTSLLVGSALCGYLATLCASGATRSLGVLLLEKCGLGAHLAKLGAGPFIALFRLDEYTVCGSLAAGLAVSIPAAQVFSRFATHRRSLLNLTVARMTEAREPMFRPLGFAATLCCVMATGMLVQVQGPRLVRDSLLEHLSAALGTEVTADVVAYDLWSGDLQMTNVRIADAAKPSDVALVVEGVSAQVEPGLMLRGRLDCNEMTVAGLFCDPTKLSQAAPAGGMFAKGPTLLKEDFAQPTHNEDPLRAVEVQGLVRNWSGVCDRLLVVERLVGFVERIADLENPTAASHALKACVERRRAHRDPISGALAPLVQVKSMKIERLPSSWKLSGHSGLALTDLTSNPKLATRSTGLTFHDAERRVTLNTVFDLLSTTRRHQVTVEAHDVALEALVSHNATRAALEPITSGTTSLQAQGWVTREQLQLDLSASLQGLQVAHTSGALAGIDAAVWRQGLQKLGTLPLEGSLRGRWSNPKLTLVPGEVVHTFKQKLLSAGAHEIVKAFETNKPVAVTATATAKSLASTEPTAEAKAEVSPNATAATPKPAAPAPSASQPVTTLTSGVATKPSALQPPMGPLTIQPMAMTGSTFPPTPATTGVASTVPSNLPYAVPAATSKSSTESAISAATKAQTEALLAGSPLKPASPSQFTATKPTAATTTSAATTSPFSSAVATNAPPAAAPLKTLPKEPFNVVEGNPWKEPTVVQGTAIAAAAPSVAVKATPAFTQTAPQVAAPPRAPLGVASDNAATTKTAETPKPAVASTNFPNTLPNSVPSTTPSVPAGPQELASSTEPALGLAQGAAKPKLPSTAAGPIPTSIDAAAGLRQPLSVLEPSTAPGPINMTVGYDADRNLATPPEAAPKVVKKPATPTTQNTDELPAAPRDTLMATRPVAKPRIETFDSATIEPREPVAVKPAAKAATPKPARPPIADDIAVDEPAPNEVVEPAPKRKSILGSVTGWFGRGPKPEQSDSVETESPRLPEPTAAPDEVAPVAKPKKLFGKIRSFFGEQTEVEMIPSEDSARTIDRQVVPSTGDAADANTAVQPSSFDATSRESKRAAAPAEFNTDATTAEAAPKPIAVSPGAAPRPVAGPRPMINLTRTRAPNSEPKPLAEDAEFNATANAETTSSAKRAPEPTPELITEPAEEAPTTAAKAPAKTRSASKQATERMSAGESFYNRMVR